MLIQFLNKIFGNRNERILHCMRKIVDMINAMESKMEELSDEQLKEKTVEFRSRIAKGESIENLIPEAFAVVREASKRVFGMRHFDVQLLGGIVLNKRCIAEMRTGEGKTLTATLPAYLNALSGKGVHIVTVNDYLARRDAENNSPLFKFLGMSVGINLAGMSTHSKRVAYSADITYGTNNEYGFDYLRDNMIFDPEERVQRSLHYAIIDEVDSILIDEARTPLIISGPAEDSSELYRRIDKIIPYLLQQEKEDSDTFHGKGHFSVDEKTRQVNLTERGLVLIEDLLVQEGIMKKGESLYSSGNIILMHHVIAALRAHALFTCDVDYIVKDGEVIIVDEHTGRIMQGRRWSDGLHQAVEAKERVEIQKENQTLASITFQNYFRLYEKLSGMTGTADTESFEFNSIYKLDTIVIPTNRPMIRKDMSDLVYMTETEKIQSIITDIRKRTEIGQPVLVGTVSIEKSQIISNALTKSGIKHSVLNAKFHAKEADIIAQAGYPAAVTIATNMAGRGTDIMLGGNWKAEVKKLKKPTLEQIEKIKSDWKSRYNAVLAAGGLHIIGTERHESRRIDNQLRGRAGRQGDVGSSRFYLSMEDSLMRIFASDRISKMMRKLGMKPGEVIEHPWVTKAIENAQRKVESYNFDVRKQLLEYDDVANDQRRAIYEKRNELLNATDISHIIASIREDVFRMVINNHIPPQSLEKKWNIEVLQQCLKNDFDLELPLKEWFNSDIKICENVLHERILESSIRIYKYKEELIGSASMRRFEKNVMLKTLDSMWKEHLAAIDYLRQGIHLRGYAQKDPKQEYKRESFSMFSSMLESLKYEVISTLSKIQVCRTEGKDRKNQYHKKEEKGLVQISNSRFINKFEECRKERNKMKNIVNIQLDYPKVGRNEPCPCGSAKKYKQCHGRLY